MTVAKLSAGSPAAERRARKRAERLLEERTAALARAEAEIKDTKARFLDFAEIASDWLWEMDADLRFTDLVGYIADTTGVVRQDVIGKTLAEIGLIGIDEEATLRQFEAFKERQPFRDSIGKIRDHKGHCHYYNISGRPVFSSPGVFLGYRGTASDITQAIEAQAARRESEDRVRGILDNVADGVITIDEKGKIETFNPAAEAIFGYHDGEMIGRAVSTLIAGPDRRRHPGYLRDYIETGRGGIVGVGPREGVARRKDGTTFPISLTVGEMRVGGRRVFVGSVRDISERKKAEQALMESEQRLTAFFDNAPVGLGMWDEQLRFTKVNEPLAELNNVSPQDHIGRTLPEVLPQIGGRLETAYRSLLKLGGKTLAVEKVMEEVTVNGETRQHRVARFAIPGPDGRAIGVGAVIADATDQIRAEQKLLMSEKRFRGLAEGSIQGVHVHRNFKSQYANQAYADIFGYASPDEILALDNMMALIAPHERGRLRGYRKRRMAGKSVPRRYEFEGLRKDGTLIWLESQVGTVDWDGAPATQATVIDITERKEAEQALRDSEARFRDFAESAGDWFWEMDENLRFTYLSPNVERILGTPPEWYYGKTRTDLLGDDYDREVWGGHLETLRNQRPFRDHTYRRTGEDGAELWVRTSGLPVFDVAGRFTGYRGTASDITALKQAEEERTEMQARLFQAQKMEALGTLAGGVAHDFNNILTIIMGFAELLEIDLKDGSDEHHSAEQILEAGRRATSLVQQILAFTRQHEQSYEPVRLDRLVAEVHRLLRATLPSSIDIRTDGAVKPVTILGDPTQIHQLIMNLCVNASHAIGESTGVIEIGLATCRAGDSHPELFEGMHDPETGLPVEIATGEDGNRHLMQIGILESDECCRLSIRDTGAGMDRATLERAFDPFFTTKEVGKGTGIGLSAVQGIVSAHGGAVSVETEPGQGTSFTIYLPTTSLVAGAEARAGEDTPGKASARILFVDDEAALVNIAVKTLEAFGYRVVGMSDSERALEAFTAEPDGFDLIVTDLTMPKMTGFELARAAVGLRADIPVILCTGYSANLDQPGTRAKGISELLYKPVFGRKLVNAVERALSAPNGKRGK